MNFSLIRRTGKTLATIAKEAGITYRQLRRYETGENEATESVIIKLCMTLNCSADELLGLKEIPSETTRRGGESTNDIEKSEN